MIADAYLESKIYSAGPEELVRIMYDAALDAVGRARRHVRNGDPAARARDISRAHAILGELAQSLDHTAAPQLARQLAELYDYMQRRLLDAQIAQSEEPLVEVSRLLGILVEGWTRLVPAAA